MENRFLRALLLLGEQALALLLVLLEEVVDLAEQDGLPVVRAGFTPKASSATLLSSAGLSSGSGSGSL
jgi:hypothetical protein